MTIFTWALISTTQQLSRSSNISSFCIFLISCILKRLIIFFRLFKDVSSYFDDHHIQRYFSTTRGLRLAKPKRFGVVIIHISLKWKRVGTNLTWIKGLTRCRYYTHLAKMKSDRHKFNMDKRPYNYKIQVVIHKPQRHTSTRMMTYAYKEKSTNLVSHKMSI